MFHRLALPIAVLATLPVAAKDAGGILEVFQNHCVQCHGQDGKVKGKVNLLAVDHLDTLGKDAELLTKIIDAIDFEEMPPEDEPQLNPGQRERFLRDLEALLDRSLGDRKTYPLTPIRRMNRFQYDNAVVDLFELNRVVFSLPERMMRGHGNYFRPETGQMAATVSVGSRPLGKSQMIEPRLAGVAPFPQDLRAEHGFDNRGDHLSLSPLLMESFLKLGQSVVASHDFSPRNVGIWQWFFAPPPAGEDTRPAVRSRLERFLTRAFRRPATPELLDRYAGFVDRRIADGVPYTEAMKEAAAAAISSPRFLYLYDGSHAEDGASPVTGVELASRLSFFLWGSIPDEELLDLAIAGDLSEPAVVEAQLARMLRDRKLKRFCDSFPSQWLQLERIISSTPNREKFPAFYFSKYRTSMHMMLEPLLIFETVLIENRAITQLIDSDFTYRSARLQSTYKELTAGGETSKGGGGVTAIKFNRLPVTDRRSGGVITNAAVMTMTSGPERSKPITRGAWIAGVIFNNPPEPPPADVPPLDEKPGAGEENLTLRERLSAHRERADCRGCHEQIDPLGFALENYDAVGNWRRQYDNGRAVDVAGTLFRKHRFGNVVEFKEAILAEKDRFTRALAGHLLSFALARDLGPADQPALDEITRRTAADEYRMQDLLRHVVLSEPFHTKSNPRTGSSGSTP
ncbi:MAG: DUF1592 domain-containing protein [Akkermansiaceae bacterium]|nr:DUF1592 domain-containing protein [Akkermansiaceae bacterium]